MVNEAGSRPLPDWVTPVCSMAVTVGPFSYERSKYGNSYQSQNFKFLIPERLGLDATVGVKSW